MAKNNKPTGDGSRDVLTVLALGIHTASNRLLTPHTAFQHRAPGLFQKHFASHFAAPRAGGIQPHYADLYLLNNIAWQYSFVKIWLLFKYVHKTLENIEDRLLGSGMFCVLLMKNSNNNNTSIEAHLRIKVH